MSVRIAPSQPEHYAGVPAYGPGQPAGTLPPTWEPESIPWSRYMEALRRHVWLMLAVVVLGSIGGLVYSKRVKPEFDVQATLWINPGSTPESGPIRGQQLLSPTSWVELMRSFAIIEPVVRKLRLNVGYTVAADSVFFREFESHNGIRPGAFVLRADNSGHYELTTIKGEPLERGMLGDSVGRSLGFGWAPPATLFARKRVLEFSVSTPRAKSLALLANLHSMLPEDGQFLTLTLTGADAQRTSATLNAWVNQFVDAAGQLKKRHLLEFKHILADQLDVAERELRNSEIQLEQFRVNTITLPSDATPVAGGVQATRDPVISNFFQQKQSLAEVQNERAALQKLIDGAKSGELKPEAFIIMLPSVLNSSPQLRAAIEDLSAREASLHSEQQYLTDANPRIKQLKETVHTLQYETIPQIAESVLQSLTAREKDMSERVDNESHELRAIPVRTIEEMRLVRQVAATENLYKVLKARYDEISLSEAQSTADLSVLDFAVPPAHPNSNDAPRLFLLAVIASIGAAAALAILHDRVDRRFRYPEQATRDLRLSIIGTVPRFRAHRSESAQLEAMSQALESFRTLRLGVRYQFALDAPVILTVSSPNSNDGKSMVSANLAIAFASAGHPTLLIDGDVRAGGLHQTFDLPVTPGLVEYLSATATMDGVIRSSASDNLFILPRGARANHAPELLVSDRMSSLIQAACQKFEVIIIDSPPLVAGVDAYALSAVAGNLLVVLRPGVSDRKLAANKLSLVDRLPIRKVGAVINGVPAGGLYRDYGTDYPQRKGTPTYTIGGFATPGGNHAHV